MDVSYDHSSEVELWGVLLCAQQVPRPHTHTLTHRQTDRQTGKRKMKCKRERRRARERGRGKFEGGREGERNVPHPVCSTLGIPVPWWHHVSSSKQTALLSLTGSSLSLSSQSVPPPPPLFSFSLTALFCFVFTNNKRDARVSSRQETSFLWRLKRAASPPPHTPPYEWADHTNWAAPTG